MSSVLRVMIGLGLFLGVGFVARYYYQEWAVAAVKEAAAANAKETSQWKPVTVKFTDLKIDQTINTMPKPDFNRQPIYQPKH